MQHISPNFIHNQQVQPMGVVELVTVLVAVSAFRARVLTVLGGAELPSGLLSPIHHSLQAGVRDWVKKQTQQPMGYVEQLYTFVDTQRTNDQGLPVLYVSYLGLVKEEKSLAAQALWQDWYVYFPWEDVRYKDHMRLHQAIMDALYSWAQDTDDTTKSQRHARIAMVWGLDGHKWADDMALLRYEMLYEAGLVAESPFLRADFDVSLTGRYMHKNHRRVLATALARLRAKIKYRPVIFELMPDSFTLLSLQKSIESLIGCCLHKSNFRRQIFAQDLLQPCVATDTSKALGRPATYYRFKDDVLLERALSSSRLPVRP